MITYSLRCGKGHEFEGWYRDSKAFDAMQAAKKLICAYPGCKSHKIEKAPMAPSINRGGNPQSIRHSELEDVGTRFAEEVRKYAPGDRSPSFTGLATYEEIIELHAEGHPIRVTGRAIHNPKKHLN